MLLQAVYVNELTPLYLLVYIIFFYSVASQFLAQAKMISYTPAVFMGNCFVFHLEEGLSQVSTPSRPACLS